MDVSTYNKFGIPDAVGVMFFAFSLVIFLAPYLPSIKVGGVEISNLSDRQKRLCIFLGPILLLSSMALFYPAHYRFRTELVDGAEIYEFSNEENGTVFRGTIALFDDCTFAGPAGRFPANRSYPTGDIDDSGAFIGRIDGKSIEFRYIVELPDANYVFPGAYQYRGRISDSGGIIRGRVDYKEFEFDVSPPIDGC
jgi:hypothetical protein